MEHTFLVMFFLKCCQISIVIVIEEQMKGGKKRATRNHLNEKEKLFNNQKVKAKKKYAKMLLY